MNNYKTRKNVPWRGWSKIAPNGKERTAMYKKCGKKCFLGTISKSNRQHPNFPICAKKTCSISSKGLWAAYVRAKEWGNPMSTYKTKGKMVIQKTKKGTRRFYSKGSRPTRKRSLYANVAQKAKSMLQSRGFVVGK